MMLEIIKNGGPLLESEARGMKGGLRTLIDEADLEQGRLRLGIETKGAGEGKRNGSYRTTRPVFSQVRSVARSGTGELDESQITTIMAEQEELKKEVVLRYLRNDRNMIPDLGPDLDDLIDDGLSWTHFEDALGDARGRWAKVRGVLMGMGRAELQEVAKEAEAVNGNKKKKTLGGSLFSMV